MWQEVAGPRGIPSGPDGEDRPLEIFDFVLITMTR